MEVLRELLVPFIEEMGLFIASDPPADIIRVCTKARRKCNPKLESLVQIAQVAMYPQGWIIIDAIIHANREINFRECARLDIHHPDSIPQLKKHLERCLESFRG